MVPFSSNAAAEQSQWTVASQIFKVFYLPSVLNNNLRLFLLPFTTQANSRAIIFIGCCEFHAFQMIKIMYTQAYSKGWSAPEVMDSLAAREI